MPPRHALSSRAGVATLQSAVARVLSEPAFGNDARAIAAHTAAENRELAAIELERLALQASN